MFSGRRESDMEHIKIRFVDSQEGTEHDLIRTVEEMLHLYQPSFAFSQQKWRPHVDMYETGGEIVIIAELAGIHGEGIDLEISSHAVKISGRRNLLFINRGASPGKESGSYCRAEIHSGHFERTVSLPAPVNPATAETAYSEGLLKIRLGKTHQEELTKIAAKTY
jgi:HSP20 family protein